jgi:hypothetical protein
VELLGGYSEVEVETVLGRLLRGGRAGPIIAAFLFFRILMLPSWTLMSRRIVLMA